MMFNGLYWFGIGFASAAACFAEGTLDRAAYAVIAFVFVLGVIAEKHLTKGMDK